MEYGEDKGFGQALESLESVEDFLTLTSPPVTPAQTAIEAAMVSQRSTNVYRGGVEHGNHLETKALYRWKGQPNSAL